MNDNVVNKYKEWAVTKINTAGKKQKRMFGLDRFKVYNYMVDLEVQINKENNRFNPTDKNKKDTGYN